MVWSVGAISMIILGAASVAIGVSLPMLEYAIVGGILVVAGIVFLIALRRAPLAARYLPPPTRRGGLSLSVRVQQVAGVRSPPKGYQKNYASDDQYSPHYRVF